MRSRREAVIWQNSMRRRFRNATGRAALAGALAVLPLLAGCGGDDPPAPQPVTIADVSAPPRDDGSNSSGLSLFGTSQRAEDANARLGINAFLWRGALDTLAFMPLASADPYGGVLNTDWYQPPGSTGERFKATAYVLGRQLSTTGLKVTIFRQVLQNGQWTDAPVSPQTTTDIENKILARARELRASATASN